MKKRPFKAAWVIFRKTPDNFLIDCNNSIASKPCVVKPYFEKTRKKEQTRVYIGVKDAARLRRSFTAAPGYDIISGIKPRIGGGYMSEPYYTPQEREAAGGVKVSIPLVPARGLPRRAADDRGGR